MPLDGPSAFSPQLTVSEETGLDDLHLSSVNKTIHHKFSFYDRLVLWLLVLLVMIFIALEVLIYLKPMPQSVNVVHETVQVHRTEFQWVRKNSDPAESWVLSGLLLEQGHLGEAKFLLVRLQNELSSFPDMGSFWQWVISEQLCRIEQLLSGSYAIKKEDASLWERLGIHARPLEKDAPWHRSLKEREAPLDYLAYKADYEDVLNAYRMTLKVLG